MTRIVPALAALLLVVPGTRAGAQRSATDSLYEVHAVRYATLPAYPVRNLVAGADSARTLDLAMMVWVLRGADGRVVLVDAGFHRQELLDRWRPADFVRPSVAVSRLGFVAEHVTDVVLTHVHWDHMDGVDLFPEARVWIQRAEYEHYVAEDGSPAASGIDPADAETLWRLRSEGRLALVDGDAEEILPGVTVYTGGRHTFESQYVGVRTLEGSVVVASDNLYLYENLDRHRPIAQTFDAESNLAAQIRMLSIAGHPGLIVPGHDPLVFERFEEVSPGVALIARGPFRPLGGPR